MFFISLLSFSVGTFVGKQVSDSEHRKLALEGEYKGDGRAVASESSSTEEEPAAESASKISEKEIASLTEEFVNKDAEAAPAGEDREGYKTYARKGEGREIASVSAEKTEEPAAHETGEKHEKADAIEKHDRHEKVEKTEAPEKHEKPAEAVHKLAEKIKDAPHRAAEKVAEGKSPSDGEVEKSRPVKTGLPPVEGAAVGKFTVQIASFGKEDDAKTRAAELKAKGYQAFYLPATVNAHQWYRVLVGLFGTSKEADEFRAKLIKEGGTKTAIVQKIVQ